MSPRELNNYRWLDAEEVRPPQQDSRHVAANKAYNRIVKKMVFDLMEDV